MSFGYPDFKEFRKSGQTLKTQEASLYKNFPWAAVASWHDFKKMYFIAVYN